MIFPCLSGIRASAQIFSLSGRFFACAFPVSFFVFCNIGLTFLQKTVQKLIKSAFSACSNQQNCNFLKNAAQKDCNAMKCMLKYLQHRF